MSKLNLPLASNIAYPGPAFKITAAILAANAVILFEEKPVLSIILSNRGFYIASVFSCIVAYFAIRLVFWITCLLDHHAPWYKNYNKRLLWQLFLGVVTPVLPLFMAATIYFSCQHVNVLDTVYVRRYIPLILLLLIALSAYLHYVWEKKHRAKKVPKSLLLKKQPLQLLQLPIEEIAYLFAENKNCYAVNFFGEKLIWNLTLTESMAQLPSHQFFQVHRSLVISLMAIEDISVVAAKTVIILKDPLPRSLNINETPLPIKKEVSPSARENAPFKRWYVQYQKK